MAVVETLWQLHTLICFKLLLSVTHIHVLFAFPVCCEVQLLCGTPTRSAPYSLDQTPRLLFILLRKFVQLLFESGYYSRAEFIKLGMEDEEIHCLKEGGVAADARKSIRRDTATLATAMDTKFEESDPFTDVEEDKDDELEENKLVLEDC